MLADRNGGPEELRRSSFCITMAHLNSHTHAYRVELKFKNRTDVGGCSVGEGDSMGFGR